MTLEEYKIIYEDLALDTKNLKLTISVYDINTSTTYQFNELPPEMLNNNFTIVLDQYNEDCVFNYPDNYYCNTLTDLKSIISFVVNHQDLYLNDLQDSNKE